MYVERVLLYSCPVWILPCIMYVEWKKYLGVRVFLL